MKLKYFKHNKQKLISRFLTDEYLDVNASPQVHRAYDTKWPLGGCAALTPWNIKAEL